MNSILLTGTDLGNPALQGSTEPIVNGYQLVAGGSDIWGKSDQFHFAYALHKGDFDLTVRLEALSKADLYTKAGVMARDSLEADSSHVFFMAFPDNSTRNKNNGGLEFQYREVKGGGSAAIYPQDYTSEPPEFPVRYPQTWLRLKRWGNQFQAWSSTEGDNWRLYAEKVVELSHSIHLGFAVTSHNVNQTATARFADIKLS